MKIYALNSLLKRTGAFVLPGFLTAGLLLGASACDKKESVEKAPAEQIQVEAKDDKAGGEEAEAKEEAKAEDEAKVEEGEAKVEGETFTMTKDAPADVAQAPEDAEKTETGLLYKVLKKGESTEKPSAADTVRVHYSGWTTDGKNFDAQLPPGPGISFPLNQVIAGWTEGLQLMAPGDTFRFWIPEDLAYKGQPGRPQGMLVFDVALLEVTKAPEAPKDVAAIPEDAQKTESGLAYKVLSEGEGGDKPTAESTVTVHYSGWTTDGKMFDSSVLRGRPASFPLRGVIPGWTEGLQLMDKGSKVRFWIPEALAYQGRPGAPAGMLVFDVELISFQ